MDEEMKALERIGDWEIVERQRGKKLLGCQCIQSSTNHMVLLIDTRLDQWQLLGNMASMEGMRENSKKLSIDDKSEYYK